MEASAGNCAGEMLCQARAQNTPAEAAMNPVKANTRSLTVPGLIPNALLARSLSRTAMIASCGRSPQRPTGSDDNDEHDQDDVVEVQRRIEMAYPGNHDGGTYHRRERRRAGEPLLLKEPVGRNDRKPQRHYCQRHTAHSKCGKPDHDRDGGADKACHNDHVDHVPTRMAGPTGGQEGTDSDEGKTPQADLARPPDEHGERDTNQRIDQDQEQEKLVPRLGEVRQHRKECRNYHDDSHHAARGPSDSKGCP